MISKRIFNTLALAPLLVLSAVPASVGASPPRVVSCSTYADYPNLLISSARGMSCSTARSVMKSFHGDISRSFAAPRGFTCRQVSGAPEGGQWRCTREAQAFRFEFKD